MAVTFVGTPSGVSAASAATLTAAFGTGQTDTVGDILIAVYCCGGVTTPALPATPAGWTLATSFVNANGAIGFYWKVAAGSDTWSVTDPTLTSGRCAVVLYECQAGTIDSSNPIDTTFANTATGTATTLTVSGFTTTNHNGQALLAAAAFNETTAAATTVADSANWVSDFAYTASAKSHPTMASLTAANTGNQGSTGSNVFTWSTTSGTFLTLAQIVALNPPSTGPTITATATGTQGIAGICIDAAVYTGVTEKGGNIVANATTNGTNEPSFTPTFSNSAIAWATTNGTSTTDVMTAAASNSVAGEPFISIGNATVGSVTLGHYTGTVTANSAVTLGGTTANADVLTLAGVELPPNGTPAVDSSSPTNPSSVGATSASIKLFSTPPPGSVIVIAVHQGASNTAGTVSETVSGGGYAWTLRETSTHTATGINDYVSIWTATVPVAAAGPDSSKVSPAWSNRFLPQQRSKQSVLYDYQLSLSGKYLTAGDLAFGANTSGYQSLIFYDPQHSRVSPAWSNQFLQNQLSKQSILYDRQLTFAGVYSTAGDLAFGALTSGQAAVYAEPDTALPGPAWQNQFFPERYGKKAVLYDTPASTPSFSGVYNNPSGDIVFGAVTTGQAAVYAEPDIALPGPAWQNLFLLERRTKQAVLFDYQLTFSGNYLTAGDLAFGATSVGYQSLIFYDPEAAVPGPAWFNQFRAYLGKQLVLFDYQLSLSGNYITAGDLAFGAISVGSQILLTTNSDPQGALPGPAWQNQFLPERLSKRPVLYDAPVPPSSSIPANVNGVTATVTVSGIAGTPVGVTPAFQVTATETSGANEGILIRLIALSGVAAAPIGNSATDTTIGGILSASLTTTAVGSMVYGALDSNRSSTPFTALATTTLIDNFSDTHNTAVYATFQSSSSTSSPGPTSFGSSAPAATGCLAGLEILPNGTITQLFSDEAESNTASTVTATNATVPPPGSVVIALVSAEGDGSNPTSVNVTGGNLTWTEQVKSTGAGLGYAGVWVAIIPNPQDPASALPGQAWQNQFLLERHTKQAVLYDYQLTIAGSYNNLSGDLTFGSTSTAFTWFLQSPDIGQPGPAWQNRFGHKRKLPVLFDTNVKEIQIRGPYCFNTTSNIELNGLGGTALLASLDATDGGTAVDANAGLGGTEVDEAAGLGGSEINDTLGGSEADANQLGGVVIEACLPTPLPPAPPPPTNDVYSDTYSDNY